MASRHAVSDQAKAAYDQSVAAYREIILTLVKMWRITWPRCASGKRIKDSDGCRNRGGTYSDTPNSLYKGGLTTYLQVSRRKAPPSPPTHGRRYYPPGVWFKCVADQGDRWRMDRSYLPKVKQCLESNANERAKISGYFIGKIWSIR